MTNTTVYSIGMYQTALYAKGARQRKWSTAILLALLSLVAVCLLVGMLVWYGAVYIAIPALVACLPVFAMYRAVSEGTVANQARAYLDLQGEVTVSYSFEEECICFERKSLVSTDRGEIRYAFLLDVLSVDAHLLLLQTPLNLPFLVYEPEGATELLRLLQEKRSKQ